MSDITTHSFQSDPSIPPFKSNTLFHRKKVYISNQNSSIRLVKTGVVQYGQTVSGGRAFHFRNTYHGSTQIPHGTFQGMVFLTLQRFVCWPTTCEMPSDSKFLPKTFENRSGFFCFRLVISRLEISKQDLPSGKTGGDAKGGLYTHHHHHHNNNDTPLVGLSKELPARGLSSP